MSQNLAPNECEKCLKTTELCVCEAIRPLKTKLHVLILQHPQEPDKLLGSARIAHLALPNSTLKVGLSWANLKKALGREVQSSKWGVLYLGSGIKGRPQNLVGQALQFVSKSGEPLPAPQEHLEGIVILDGTWSQAKALWWRNAWLLKLRRVILVPERKSLYRELRKEPRGECLSTIESLAECLRALGEPVTVESGLKDLFATLLDKQRARLKARKSSISASASY